MTHNIITDIQQGRKKIDYPKLLQDHQIDAEVVERYTTIGEPVWSARWSRKR